MISDSRKGQVGVFLLGVLTLFPIVPWIFMKPLSERFLDASTALTSVSQVSALMGTVLFALYCIVTISPSISAYIFPQAQTQVRMSEGAGLIATLLLLAHPFVLLIEGMTQSAALLGFRSDWSFLFGVYALLLLLTAHGIRLLSRGSERLQRLPLVMAAVLFLGTLHAFFIPSDLSQNIIIKAYVLTMVAVALGLYVPKAFLYKAVLPAHIQRLQQDIVS